MKKKPRVTLILFCYNQEKFIEESIASALNQDYKNLKIVISDDNSTDNTYAIAKSLLSDYTNNSNIILNKNPKNLGIGKHFSYAMSYLAEGELVVPFGGDDISYSNRVSRIVEEWLKNNKPSLIAHNLDEINEVGKKIIKETTIRYRYNKTEKKDSKLLLYNYLTFMNPIPFIGAAIAYRLDTFFKFGSPKIYPDYEDHLMYFRSLIHGGIFYFDDILVNYRRHDKSYTINKSRPKIINNSQLSSFFIDSITEDNISIFRWHQVVVQQWIDYSHAIKENLTIAEYKVIDHLWKSIITRHNYLTEKIEKVSYITPLKAVLYGTGNASKNTINNISPGFEIISVCDSNTLLHGKKFFDYIINSPEYIHKNINNIDCILVASMHYFEIKNYLVEYFNIPDYKIIRIPFNLLNGF